MVIEVPGLAIFADLSKPMAALLGAVIMGGLVLIGGALIIALRTTFSPRAGDFQVPVIGSVSPGFFYFRIVAPVWAVVGALAGYQLGGQ